MQGKLFIMKFVYLFIFVLSLVETHASASDVSNSDGKLISQYPYGECLLNTAHHYQVSPDLLIAMIKTESNHVVSAININTSGSEDVGLMQINSEWFPQLKKLGYERESLFDPCTNITVGTWILAQEIQRFGYTWNAVGAFNAGPSQKKELRRARYAQRVYSNLPQ